MAGWKQKLKIPGYHTLLRGSSSRYNNNSAYLNTAQVVIIN